MRIVALYLMDSIIKNVGRDYITLFGRNIIKIFSDTFALVSIVLNLHFKH